MSNKKHTKEKKPYEDEVNRLLEASDCETLGELGRELGYKTGNNLTNWKDRGLDYNKIIPVYPTISVKYLETGEGPMFYDEYEKEFNVIANRTNDVDNLGTARGLLLEALVKEASRIQDDLQNLIDDIEKLAKLNQHSDD